MFFVLFLQYGYKFWNYFQRIRLKKTTTPLWTNSFQGMTENMEVVGSSHKTSRTVCSWAGSRLPGSWSKWCFFEANAHGESQYIKLVHAVINNSLGLVSWPWNPGYLKAFRFRRWMQRRIWKLTSFSVRSLVLQASRYDVICHYPESGKIYN